MGLYPNAPRVRLGRDRRGGLGVGRKEIVADHVTAGAAVPGERDCRQTGVISCHGSRHRVTVRGREAEWDRALDGPGQRSDRDRLAHVRRLGAGPSPCPARPRTSARARRAGSGWSGNHCSRCDCLPSGGVQSAGPAAQALQLAGLLGAIRSRPSPSADFGRW